MQTEALLIRQEEIASGCLLQLEVQPSLAYFAGHFPGLPILPGVVQIDWVVRHARKIWPELTSVLQVQQLKFQKVVKPGAQLALELTRPSVEPVVRFQYRTPSGDLVSGGRIVFQGA